MRNRKCVGLFFRAESSVYLSDTPRNKEWRLFGIWQHTTGSIVETEIRCSINNDTLDGYSETTVKTGKAITFENLAQAITETTEFTFSASFTDISSQPIRNGTLYVISISEFHERIVEKGYS